MVNRVMLVSLCAETIKPVSEGDKNLTAVEGNASVYPQVYPVSRVTGEGRAECLRAWGHGFYYIVHEYGMIRYYLIYDIVHTFVSLTTTTGRCCRCCVSHFRQI